MRTGSKRMPRRYRDAWPRVGSAKCKSAERRFTSSITSSLGPVIPLADILSKVGALTRIANLSWASTTTDHDLLALSLVTTYGLSSIFDSYHAATCLLEDPERKMVSTDDAYDRIPRITRIDPRKLAAEIREEESKKAKR